jgi:hypothetical protein
MAIQLSSVASTLLPPTITGPIFAKATETSAVQSLARRVPLSVAATTAIPVTMDVPVADWVAEAGVKPAAQVGVGVKTMTGKKVALLLPVAEEVVNTNPAGLYDQLSADLPTALARAFDYAAINGLSLRTGAAGPFPEYLALATNTVALGTTANSAGGLYVDVVTGAGKVIDKNYDVTGIAADPRLKIDAQLQVDSQGRPVYTDAVNSAGHSAGTVAGFPTYFNKGVSGKYWRAGDKTQTVTINGTPTGGTFLLMSGGNSTSQAYNATGATLQTAVRAWGGIYAGVTVTGSAGGPYTITFPDVATNVTAAAAPFAVNQTALTGGTAATAKATIAATGAGGTDTQLRGIGGDFSQCAYGVGMDISIRISTEASYYDGATWHSAFQENLVLLLCEAYYGFVMGSPDAFVAYTKGTAAF